MIFGNATLGMTTVKFKPSRRKRAQVAQGAGGVAEDDIGPTEEANSTGPSTELHLGDDADNFLEDPEVVARAGLITEILQCCGLVGPPGVPNEGRVLRPSSVVAFVARHRRLAALRGLDVARPRVAFHWTQERNFEGIARDGLKVPDGAGVAVAHGSSFGLGVYVSPDFRYGKELFAYGAQAAFMCLSLPGRQHFGKPSDAAMEGYDSVVGREGQRGVDEWVFFRQDQLLPCFLVDELGLILAREAAQAAIKVLHQPWPDGQPCTEAAKDGTEALEVPASTSGSGRWRRTAVQAVDAPEHCREHCQGPLAGRRWSRVEQIGRAHV